jgi:hypothetical protein
VAVQAAAWAGCTKSIKQAALQGRPGFAGTPFLCDFKLQSVFTKQGAEQSNNLKVNRRAVTAFHPRVALTEVIGFLTTRLI